MRRATRETSENARLPGVMDTLQQNPSDHASDNDLRAKSDGAQEERCARSAARRMILMLA